MPALVFFLALLFPPEANFSVGGLVLSPQRVFLLASIIPSLILLISRRAGPIGLIDVALAFHAAWAFVTFCANHGLARAIQSGGIYSVEALGAYLVSRIWVRDVRAFLALARLIVYSVLVCGAFAVVESLTGKNVIRLSVGLLGGHSGLTTGEQRMGLFRACGPFQHQIIFGVFCANAFVWSWYALPRRRRAVRAVLVALAVACSVSSAAIFSLAIQAYLIAWDQFTSKIRGRWVVCFGLVAGAYSAIELLSNRSASTVLISYLTFNADTGYWRQLIWQYGGAEVMRHPLFGIGFSDWARPVWMYTSSIDNFWLLLAVRHGFPGVISMVVAVIAGAVGLMRRQLRDPIINRCRKVWLIGIVALAFSAFTVHLWGSAFTLFCFLLGTGSWMTGAGGTSVPRTGGTWGAQGGPSGAFGERVSFAEVNASAEGDAVWFSGERL